MQTRLNGWPRVLLVTETLTSSQSFIVVPYEYGSPESDKDYYPQTQPPPEPGGCLLQHEPRHSRKDPRDRVRYSSREPSSRWPHRLGRVASGVRNLSADLGRWVGHDVRCGDGGPRLAHDVRVQHVPLPLVNLVVGTVGPVHRAWPPTVGRFGWADHDRVKHCNLEVRPASMDAVGWTGRAGFGCDSGNARRFESAIGQYGSRTDTRMYWPLIFRAMCHRLRAHVAVLAATLPEAQREPISSRVVSGAWLLFVIAYLQLVLGSHLRHPGILWQPSTFRTIVLLHVVTGVFLLLQGLTVTARAWRYGVKLRTPAALVGLLTLFQVGLGFATWRAKYGWPSFLPVFSEAAADTPTEIALHNALVGVTVQAESLPQALTVTGHVAVGSLILVCCACYALRVSRCYATSSQSVVETATRVPAATFRSVALGGSTS